MFKNNKGFIGKKPSKKKVDMSAKVKTKKLVSSLADRIFKK